MLLSQWSGCLQDWYPVLTSTVQAQHLISASCKRWQCLCQDVFNCVPSGRLEESTWSSSDYMDKDICRWPYVTQSHIDSVAQNWSFCKPEVMKIANGWWWQWVSLVPAHPICPGACLAKERSWRNALDLPKSVLDRSLTLLLQEPSGKK